MALESISWGRKVSSDFTTQDYLSFYKHLTTTSYINSQSFQLSVSFPKKHTVQVLFTMTFEVQQPLLLWQILNGRWIRAGWKQPDPSFNRKQFSLSLSLYIGSFQAESSLCLSLFAEKMRVCAIFLLGLSSCQSLIKIIWIKAWVDDILLS